MFSEMLRRLTKLFNSLLVFSEGRGGDGGGGGTHTQPGASNRVRRVEWWRELGQNFFSGMGEWMYDFVLV